MTQDRADWQSPHDLPPCWWIAVTTASRGLTWYESFDSKRDAESAWLWRSVWDWLEKPTRMEIVQEDKNSFVARDYRSIGRRCDVTARWNWFQRHRDVLLGWTQPKSCSIVLPASRKLDGDLYAHRLGGDAVLPKGSSWPSYSIAASDLDRYAKIDYSTGDVKIAKKKKVTPFATFVATLDLRGQFSFADGFPDAISLFVFTYEPVDGTYESYTDAYIPEGIIVPLASSDVLVETAAPAGVFRMPGLTADSFGMPDFPPMHVDLSDVMASCDSASSEQKAFQSTEAIVSKREPQSEAWIHLKGLKIGGFESYTQHSIRRSLETKFPGLQWHFIATWSDDRIAVGDSGQFYILAGFDPKSKQWTWRCASDCH